MTTFDPTTQPFKVRINGPGYSQSAGFVTMHEAYTEAHRIRKAAEKGERVLFTSWHGTTRSYTVLSVQVIRWNPFTRDYLSHARRWTLNSPVADALTPLPDDWYDEPLPDNWRTDHSTPTHAGPSYQPPRSVRPPVKPWSRLLEASFHVKQLADHSPELAFAVLALPELAKAIPRPGVGTSLPSNRFYLGQRVRVTIDGLDLFPSRTYCPRIGDLGTVTNVPTNTDPDYAVILDNDDPRKRHAFSDDELEPVD